MLEAGHILGGANDWGAGQIFEGAYEWGADQIFGGANDWGGHQKSGGGQTNDHPYLRVLRDCSEHDLQAISTK